MLCSHYCNCGQNVSMVMTAFSSCKVLKLLLQLSKLASLVLRPLSSFLSLASAVNTALLTHKQDKGLHGNHRRLQAWAYPGIARVISNHAHSYHKNGTRRPPIYIACACLRMDRRMYSVQCSDKIRFPHCASNAVVAKSCPGTHTALQVPMIGTRVILTIILNTSQ